jgi:isoleucyl-tRNA synthetase
MIKEITAKYNAEQIEKKVTRSGKTAMPIGKPVSIANRKRLFFVDGPPYTTGHIHWGLPGTRSLKIPFSAIIP